MVGINKDTETSWLIEMIEKISIIGWPCIKFKILCPKRNTIQINHSKRYYPRESNIVGKETSIEKQSSFDVH